MPVVGMAGGGQLARMTQQAAIALGVSLRGLAGAPDESAAKAVSDVRVGDDRSRDDLLAFAKGCDVVTFDHEHVPGPHIRELEESGVPCRPGAAALAHAQDKLVMRERLSGLGVPCPAYAPVPASEPAAFLAEFGREHGWPLVLKATRGGYDGKGVWIVDEPSGEVERLLAEGVALMVEQHVPFRRELAALVARSPYGQGAAYPIVETVQEGGICTEVIAPAPGLSDDLAAEAQSLALRVAEELGVVGMLDERRLVTKVDGFAGEWGGNFHPTFPPGAGRKFLRRDPVDGEETWLLGTMPLRSGRKPEKHPVVGVMYLLAGELAGPLGLMRAGCYFWRPPEEWHGPFGSPTGNLMLFRTKGGPLSTVYTEHDVDFTWTPEHRPILPPELAVHGAEPLPEQPGCLCF